MSPHVSAPLVLLALLAPAAATAAPGEADAADPEGAVAYTERTWTAPRPLLAPGGSPLPAGPNPTLVSLNTPPEGDMPRALAYTPDGARLLVVNRDTDNVAIFDAATRAITATVGVGSFPVDVAVTPDGAYAITANPLSDDLSVIDLGTDTLVATIPVTGTQPYRLAVTPDSQFVVAGVINDAVSSAFSVVDLGTMAEVATIPSASQGVFGFFFTADYDISGNIFTQFGLTPDGARIVLPDRTSAQLFVYDRVSGAQLAAIPVAPLANSMHISQDGTTAVIGHEGSEQKISVIDLGSLALTTTLDTGSNLYAQVVRITPDKSHAVAAISNNVIFVDIATNTVDATVSTGTVGDLEFTHDGQFLFVSNFNSSVIDVATRTKVATLPLAACVDAATSPVAYSAAALNNRFGERVQFYTTNGGASSVLGGVPSGPAPEGDVPQQVALSPDGSTGVVGTILSGNCAVLDVATASIRSWVDTGLRILDLSITPDGAYAVVANGDSDSVSIVDLGTDSVVATLPISSRPARVRISPDGLTAYVTSIAGSDRVWFIDLAGAASSVGGSLVSGQMGAALGYRYSEMSGIGLSPDGSVLAVCVSFDDELLLIDTATRTEIKRVAVGDFPLRVAFAPDGTRAYVGCAFSDDVYAVSINGAASSVVGVATGIDAPSSIDVDSDGASVYVGSWSSSTGGLHVVDAGTMTVSSVLGLGGGAMVRDAAYVPGEDRLRVLAYYSDHVELVEVDADGAASAQTGALPLDGTAPEVAYAPINGTALLGISPLDAADLAHFQPSVFSTTCYGDQPGTCPCGNEVAPGTEEGCINSTGVGGVLSATGSNLVGSDDLVLHAAQCRPNKTGLFLQGATTISTPFKDGILCVGNPTERLEFITLDAAGAGSSSSSIVTEGNVAPGQTRTYQFWFRDGGGLSVCGTNSNLTHGIEVDWL